MILSLELIIFWNCKFVVRGSTEVCDKIRSDLGTLQAGHTRRKCQGGQFLQERSLTSSPLCLPVSISNVK